MKYYNLDGTSVSNIGIGCMRLSYVLDEDGVSNVIHTALDAGINFFDHADIYGAGKSEEQFGQIIAKEPGLRDRMFIQSKCAIHDGMFDFSKDYILKSVDGILTRLQTDRIDSLLLHRPDALMEPEEVNEAFNELKESGKVLHFGVSNMNRYQMELLSSELKENLWADQMQMSLAHTPMVDAGFNVDMLNDASVMHDAGTIEYLRLHKMALQIWSPLQKGYFGGLFIGDEAYPELNALINELAEKYNVTPSEIAYAWLLRIPANVQVVLGTSNAERIRNAAKAADITLTRKEWYDLYKAAGNKLP